jgi:hypothetical protein
MCALSLLHHHAGPPSSASRRRTEPARGRAGTAGEAGGDGAGTPAPRPAGGAAENCGEKPHVEAARPDACCLSSR